MGTLSPPLPHTGGPFRTPEQGAGYELKSGTFRLDTIDEQGCWRMMNAGRKAYPRETKCNISLFQSTLRGGYSVARGSQDDVIWVFNRLKRQFHCEDGGYIHGDKFQVKSDGNYTRQPGGTPRDVTAKVLKYRKQLNQSCDASELEQAAVLHNCCQLDPTNMQRDWTKLEIQTHKPISTHSLITTLSWRSTSRHWILALPVTFKMQWWSQIPEQPVH